MAQAQRRFQRLPEALEMRCRRVGARSEAWRIVATHNISAGGASFESEELYDVSETLEIQIHLPSFRAPLVLLGRVVRSRSLPSGVMDCGVEFVDVTPDQQVELDALVQFLSQRVG